jgi:hypothetical protein
LKKHYFNPLEKFSTYKTTMKKELEKNEERTLVVAKNNKK